MQTRCEILLHILLSEIGDMICEKDFTQPTRAHLGNEDFTNLVNSTDNIYILIVSHGLDSVCIIFVHLVHTRVSRTSLMALKLKTGITELELPLVCHQGKWTFYSSSVKFVKVDDHCHILES